ncbi:MAG: MmgE/PrpD family protein [Pseudonocardiaceae bacterium]|nr:MmgE/PrpD family protein [Pseudonocardiaceae bacterium]
MPSGEGCRPSGWPTGRSSTTRSPTAPGSCSQAGQEDGEVALTAAVADFVAGTDPARLPDAALDLAERAFVDTVGVAVAAAPDPTVRSIWQAFGAGLPDGPSALLTRPGSTQPVQAALLNGTAAHALDFDDVADDLVGHPSAVLVPAALAVAQQTGASGRQVLAAYCAGFQVECAVAAGMSISRHYARGWHSTATLGVLGAAAAAASLLALQPWQVRHAVGIAASLAGGSRQNFGTMTKPLHAGTAASDGVFAAMLAAANFTADPDQLEAPLGYFALYGDEVDLAAALAVLGEPCALSHRGLDVKKHPCCYKAARAADAALALAEDGVHAGDVERVTVTVEPEGLGPLIHHRPVTGLQGKFSLEYIVAASLTDHRLTLRSFTDDAVCRDPLQRLLARVCVTETDPPPDRAPDWADAFAEVTVETRAGLRHTRRVDTPRGHALAPLDEDELADKFHDCLDHGGAAHDPHVLLAGLRELRECPDVHGLLRGRR